MEDLNHAFFLLLNTSEQPNVLLLVIATTIHSFLFGKLIALRWMRK